jgi:hypothetical protein
MARVLEKALGLPCSDNITDTKDVDIELSLSSVKVSCEKELGRAT